MENKQYALQLIKKAFDEYEIKNAALHPDWIKPIQYFLDWLRLADESAITDCQQKTFHIRVCDMKGKIEYFYKLGSNSYSSYYHSDATLHTFFVDDQALTSFVKNYKYSEQANSRIVPGNLMEVAESAAKDVLYSEDNDAIFSKIDRITYDIQDPVEDEYLLCELSYPYKDKEEVKLLSLRFVVYEDGCFLGGAMPVHEGMLGKATGGCYVATAVYGSYDCPEVWTLRRYRDDTLASTWYGRAFIRLYYAISPTLVNWFGHTEWFKKMWKGTLDKMVKDLNDKGVENTPYDDKDWQ